MKTGTGTHENNETRRLLRQKLNVMASLEKQGVREFSAGLFKMLFASQILFTGSVGLSFAIWATILLSQNGLHNETSEVLFAYMITDCIMNYLRIMESISDIQRAIEGKNPKVGVVTGCLSLGMFIWNIVLLFRDIGIDHISDNPYYMYVFISFMMNMTVLGLACLLLLISGFCFGFMVCSEKKMEAHATVITAAAATEAVITEAPDSLSPPSLV